MTSLNDNALTTLAAVEQMIPDYTKGASAGDDSRLTRFINAASRLFAQVADRKFHRKSGHEERVRAYGTPELYVSEFLPIDSIDSIEWNVAGTSDEVDADNYEIFNAETGYIHADGVWSDTGLRQSGIVQGVKAGAQRPIYLVTYTGGWITPKQDDDGVGTRDLPADIEQAILDQVTFMEDRHDAGFHVSKVSMDDGSVTYMKGRPVMPSFVHTVRSYRLVDV